MIVILYIYYFQLFLDANLMDIMKYVKKHLDNGMDIMMIPMKNTKIISVGFFIRAGSRNETESNNGIAHFLEHMMFKGTINRKADILFDELDTLGAQYNAATTTQYTYYYIYGNSDDTKKILDIILDIYFNTEFITKEINKERKVIIEEMRMRFDLPVMKLYSLMHKKIFKGTSLARNIIGTSENVIKFNKKDLINFRSSMYKPENTVFAIAGNFSPGPIYNLIKNSLENYQNNGNLKKHQPNKILSYPNETPIIMASMEKQLDPYVYIKRNTNLQQVYLLLAFPMYDLYKSENREIDLLAQLLSAGFSSRLSKALREENGITYASAAYPVAYSDCGLFIIQMIVNPAELTKGIKILLRELKKTKKEIMSKKEMQKIINVTKNETIFSLIRPIDVLIYCGLNLLLDKDFTPNIEAELENIKKIKRSQIQDIAKKIFIGNKINLFMCGNINETNDDFMNLCKLL